MTRPLTLALAAFAAVALGAMPETAETPASHEHGQRQLIVVDAEKVQPSETHVSRDAVLVFENHAVHPIQLRFVSPADAAERVRCRFVHRGPAGPAEEQVPWALFGVDAGRLQATIPPGRYASLCSLQPGTYDFVAARLAPKSNRPPAETIHADKGQIVVD